MLKGKLTALAVAGVATIALSFGPATAATTASQRYVGSTAGGLLPDIGPGQGPNLGGANFLVPAWATSVDVTVVDDYSDAVAADLLFVVDPYGPLIQTKTFCNSANGIPIPPGSQGMYVRLKGLAALKCSPPGIPTTGTATVTFK